MWTNESKKSSCNGVCGSVYIYLGWLNCLCTSKRIHRLLAFNYPASTVLHIILQAGSHNACLKGKISLQEGRVIELIQHLQWLMCFDIASIWWSNAEYRCKEKCMNSTKEERVSTSLHTASFKLQALPTRGKTPAEVGIYFLSKCKCPHMLVQAP